jgi:hypothetical protein
MHVAVYLSSVGIRRLAIDDGVAHHSLSSETRSIRFCRE